MTAIQGRFRLLRYSTLLSGDVFSPKILHNKKKGTSDATSEGRKNAVKSESVDRRPTPRVSQQDDDAVDGPRQARSKKVHWNAGKAQPKKWQGNSQTKIEGNRGSPTHREATGIPWFWSSGVTGDYQTRRARPSDEARRAMSFSSFGVVFRRVASECFRMATQAFRVAAARTIR